MTVGSLLLSLSLLSTTALAIRAPQQQPFANGGAKHDGESEALALEVALGEPCALAKHTSTVNATADDQVLENLSIDVSEAGTPAINVKGFKRVTIQNVKVLHGPKSAARPQAIQRRF